MILAYIGKDLEEKSLLEIFDQLQIEYKRVYDCDLDCRIGALLKKEESIYKEKNKRNTFLLFSNEKVDTTVLRDQMQKKNIYIPRIAMETEHNIHWTLKELMDAIDEEVEFFKLRESVIEKLKKPNMNRIKKDPAYIKNVSGILNRLSSEDLTLSELKEYYRYLYKI